MSDKRFEQLEEKLAYMEMANAELGEEIFRQQKEIDALTKAHRTMLERIEVLQDTAAEGGAEAGAGQGERPPHY
mgnify:FL=1|jgi:uncharacterized coiled-coil protein SlyX